MHVFLREIATVEKILEKLEIKNICLVTKKWGIFLVLAYLFALKEQIMHCQNHTIIQELYRKMANACFF